MPNGRDWTENDGATLRRLIASGLTFAHIGELMDRNPEFVRCKAKQMGLKPGQSRVHTAMMARINFRRRLLLQNKASTSDLR